MRKFIILIILLVPFSSFADQRSEKIKVLMKAQGQLETWQQQIEIGKVEGEKQARQLMVQMLTQLNPSEEFKKRFEKAFMKFMGKMQDNWTAQQIVDVWATYYGPHFTDNELDRLIEFYTSDIGKKSVKASRETMVEFSTHFRKEAQPIMQSALSEYLSELKQAVKDCNCPKKK